MFAPYHVTRRLFATTYIPILYAFLLYNDNSSHISLDINIATTLQFRSVKILTNFLRARGVTAANQPKAKLIHLCEAAIELGIKSIPMVWIRIKGK